MPLSNILNTSKFFIFVAPRFQACLIGRDADLTVAQEGLYTQC